MKIRWMGLAVLMTCLGLAAERTAAQDEEISAKLQPQVLRSLNERRAAPVPVTEVRTRIVVTLKPPATMSRSAMDYRSAAGVRAIQREVRAMQDRVFQRSVGGDYRMLYRYQSFFGFSAFADDEAIMGLAGLAEVDRIEQMPVYYKASTESHPLARVDEVHAAGLTGAGVTIAIIDDGIDHDHPAFGGSAAFPNAKILGGRDFADDDSDPTIDCLEQSHGTAVAGVAAGNGGGVTGTAPGANIVMLKVQSANLCGQPALDGDLVGAIDWAVSNRDAFGIRIISMSLGSGGFTGAAACETSSPATRNAVNAAVQAGLVVLAAAGNDGFCDRISRPACMDSAISVGAVYDATLGERGFCVSPNSCVSQPHPTCAAMGKQACFNTASEADLVTCYSNSAEFLDLLAPSECATSAAPGGGTTPCFGGTSSATPFAAGVAATMIEGEPTLTNETLRVRLRDSGVVVTDPRNGLVTPRVDALASIPMPTPADVVDLSNTVAYSDQDGDGSLTVTGGGAGLLMEGNRWRRTEQTFTVTPFTTLEFQFTSGLEGEIHGIGLDEDDELTNEMRIFQLFGSQDWGGAIQAYDGDYSTLGASATYRIPVGGFYRGDGFRLVLVNDNDAGGANLSRFDNVRVFENPPAAPALDFSALSTEAYSNQDAAGTEVIEDSGATLALSGNRWRRTAESFTIGRDTVVAFEFASGSEGEIHGLGFDENQALGDATRIFKVFGTQDWSGDVDWFGAYTNAELGGFKTYVIPVGRFYTGDGFRAVLVNDKDEPPQTNDSRLRNVRLYELN